MIEIVDQSNSDLYSQNQDLINNFTDYSSKNLDFDKPVKVYFMDDEENAKDPLGKTAHYNPDTLEIKIYVTGRHLKDILRSISHELIHHVQNCRGDFGSLDSTEAGYAQSNDHLRGMEQEAYTQGNIMNFRDFEDNYKRGTKTMSETKINKLKAMVREGVREVLSEQETVKVELKYAGKENHQKEADKRCKEKGYDGGMMISANRPPSPEGSGVYKCLKCPDGSVAGVARRHKRNPLGCGFADKPDNTKQPSATTANIGAWYDPTGLGTKGSSSGTRRSRYQMCDNLPIGKGCQGDLVKEIQRLLKIEDDGKFWTGTEKAVQAFQTSVSLEPTGIVDQETLANLQTAQSAPAPAQAPAAGTGSTAGPAAPAATTRAEVDQLFKSLSGSTRSLFAKAYKSAISKSDEDPQIFDKIKRILDGVGGLNTKQFQQRYAQLRQLGGLKQLEESLTIEQKKLNEAKSLFERLKKVL